MDWTLKALLTSLAIAGVLALARRAGSATAGLFAGLPTITAPTLAWLAHDRGVAFAADVAVSGTAACAMLAGFALGYAHAPRRGGAPVALLCGTLASALLAWPTFLASRDLALATALAVASSAVAMACMPRRPAALPARKSGTDSIVSTAAVAGTLSAASAVIGPVLGTFAAGVMSSMPVISGVAALSEHLAHGPAAAATFLRGYVDGLAGKAVFGMAFALTAIPLGAACALLLACAGAAAAATVLSFARRSQRVSVGASARGFGHVQVPLSIA